MTQIKFKDNDKVTIKNLDRAVFEKICTMLSMCVVTSDLIPLMDALDAELGEPWWDETLKMSINRDRDDDVSITFNR